MLLSSEKKIVKPLFEIHVSETSLYRKPYANMTFLSRIERTGARTHAGIQTKTRLYYQPPERLYSILKENFPY